MGFLIAYKIIEFIASRLHIHNFIGVFPPQDISDVGNITWYCLVFLIVCGIVVIFEFFGVGWSSSQGLFFIEYPLTLAMLVDGLIAFISLFAFFLGGFTWLIFTVGETFSNWFFTPWF